MFTSDDLAACVRLALQEGQQDGGLIRAVHAGLDRLLENGVDGSRTKMVWKLLHQLAVQTWAVVAVLVHVDADCVWRHKDGDQACVGGSASELGVEPDLPVQTTLEPLLWLFSAERWLELSRFSVGGAVTNEEAGG